MIMTAVTESTAKARGVAAAAVPAVRPPNAGLGRKPGVQNKTTLAVKQAILHAFDEVGGTAYLVEVARNDHKTFCTLLGRILPRDLTVDADGTTVADLERLALEVLTEDLRRARRELADRTLDRGSTHTERQP
jgi:hypothetical protein